MHLHEIIILFIKNNAWFLAPLLSLFIVLAFKNTKARKAAFVLLLLVVGFCIAYVFNKFFGHNSTFRAACLSFVGYICAMVQYVELILLINIHIIQVMYSSGILVFLYDITFAAVLFSTINLVARCYKNIFKIFKTLHIRLEEAILHTLHSTKIDLNQEQITFLQVLRV